MNLPIILTGDFNATPKEMVYNNLTHSKVPSLCSAYSDNNIEPPYTTWCIRPQGEFPRTLDYIWYTKNKFKVLQKLGIPKEADMPTDRLPCFEYPSDHLSLVCDLQLL